MDSETFDKINDLLLSRGYKPVSKYYLNGETVLHFINDKLEYARICDEELDQEDLWSMLGTSRDELVEEHGLTDKELDEESEAYMKVMKEVIEGEELKNSSLLEDKKKEVKENE
jgi:hypothetical protein